MLIKQVNINNQMPKKDMVKAKGIKERSDKEHNL